MSSATSPLDRGMQVQMRALRAALTRGMPRLGWKIGINDPRVLERLGLERSVVGWLDGDRVLPSGGHYVLRRGTRVALEAEVAVRVGSGSAAQLAPALELVNYSLPANSLEEMLEHDLFHDAVVLGRETLPVPILDDAWPHVFRNGEEVARRDGSLLVFQPSQVVRFVANTVARYGEYLETGDWVICGSLVRPIPVAVGDSFDVDFGPLGRVGVEIGS